MKRKDIEHLKAPVPRTLKPHSCCELPEEEEGHVCKHYLGKKKKNSCANVGFVEKKGADGRLVRLFQCAIFNRSCNVWENGGFTLGKGRYAFHVQ